MVLLVLGLSLTSPKLMRLACFRISVRPSRSFILRYLGQVGVSRTQGAGQQQLPPHTATM